MYGPDRQMFDHMRVQPHTRLSQLIVLLTYFYGFRPSDIMPDGVEIPPCGDDGGIYLIIVTPRGRRCWLQTLGGLQMHDAALSTVSGWGAPSLRYLNWWHLGLPKYRLGLAAEALAGCCSTMASKGVCVYGRFYVFTTPSTVGTSVVYAQFDANINMGQELGRDGCGFGEAACVHRSHL